MVTARFLYGKEFEYRPEFKLWINTNYKPQISGNDEGIWSRVKLLPSQYIFPREAWPSFEGLPSWKRDRWNTELALEGLKLWQKEGLEMPETMKLATTDYRCEMDIMQKFLDDCTKLKNNSSVGHWLCTSLHQWCSEMVSMFSAIQSLEEIWTATLTNGTAGLGGLPQHWTHKAIWKCQAGLWRNWFLK